MRRTLGLILLAASCGAMATEPTPDGIDARPRSGEKSWFFPSPPRISSSGPARPVTAASVAPTFVPLESFT